MTTVDLIYARVYGRTIEYDAWQFNYTRIRRGLFQIRVMYTNVVNT